jgi:ADP-ribosylglycohydrolase
MPNRAQRVEGGIIGLLVGDALGVPYEFEEPRPLDQIDFIPPAGHWHAWPGTPPGTWSDDGSQALCLLDSLLTRGRLDVDDLGRLMLRCHTAGYMWVDGRVFDTGVTTAEALRALRAGRPALDAGPVRESSNGNGSLMRVLPLALWHKGTDAELIADARAQSRVTHGHLRAQLCCALYCVWARRMLEGAANPWADAAAVVRAVLAGEAAARHELDSEIQPERPPGGKGSGYVVDCLHSARHAVAAGSYETAVKTAVGLGDDTDTTACVAGGIAGVRDGVGAIPERWRRQLRGNELYRPLVDALLAKG